MELKEEPIRIAAVGDVFLGDHYFTVGHGIATMSRNGMLDGTLQGVKQGLEGADIVFGNLECPISEHSEFQGAVQVACFRGGAGSGSALRKAGFTIMSIANNHILQHGSRAFQETLDELRQAGIKPVGLAASDGTPEPLIVEIRGTTVGMIGFSLVPERYTPDFAGYARGTEAELMNAVLRLRPTIDKLIVSLHFGDEGVPLPSPAVMALCSRLVDAGADVIFGHHPHIFQPVVSMKGSVVAFSLGNFLFDLFWHRPLTESAIVHLSLKNDAWKISLTPITIGKDCRIRAMDDISANRFRRKLARRKSALSQPKLYRRLYPIYSGLSRLWIQIKKYPWFAIHFRKGSKDLKSQFLLEKVGIKKSPDGQASPRTGSS